MNKQELLRKLKLLEPESKEQRNSLVCSLVGHSRIRTFFFGYNYCARCGAELGDSLGGAWKVSEEYIEGHDDKDCLLNLERMTWKDKLYVPRKIYQPPVDQESKEVSSG